MGNHLVLHILEFFPIITRRAPGAEGPNLFRTCRRFYGLIPKIKRLIECEARRVKLPRAVVTPTPIVPPYWAYTHPRVAAPVPCSVTMERRFGLVFTEGHPCKCHEQVVEMEVDGETLVNFVNKISTCCDMITPRFFCLCQRNL